LTWPAVKVTTVPPAVVVPQLVKVWPVVSSRIELLQPPPSVPAGIVTVMMPPLPANSVPVDDTSKPKL